jgi:predicted porin
MKKSVIALAVLGTVAGVASAQSSVTLYGRVDAAYSKNIGNKVRGINDTQQSRIGFKGVEDLGGGLKAVFNLESGLNTDTGAQAGSTSTGQFWNRRAVVGLETGFGRVLLGREYTPAYTLVEAVASPWGTDTVAGNAGGLRKIITGGADTRAPFGNGTTNQEVDTIRADNSVNYYFSTSGFSVGAQWAAKETTSNATKNPFGLAASYSAGPVYVALGYTNPADRDDHWTTLHASYDFGIVKLGGFFGTGRQADDDKTRSWLLSATAPIGGGELRVAYGQLKDKVGGTGTVRSEAKVTALGYHYFLSKRTRIYVDVANDSKNAISKTGYDFGVRHDF